MKMSKNVEIEPRMGSSSGKVRRTSYSGFGGVSVAIQQVSTMQDVEELLRASVSRPVLLLKHSTACPVSARAHGEFCGLAARRSGAGEGPLFALVRVIEERPVSLALAARLGVRHQSPQAILIRDGRAVWHASHHEVTAAAMETAWRTLGGFGGRAG